MADDTCRGKDCDAVVPVPGGARGLCVKHYKRWKRYGDQDFIPPKMSRRDPNPGGGATARECRLAQFYANVALPDGNGCMQWLGTGSKGYGSFWDGSRTMRTHVLSWMLAYGEPPGGDLTDLDHLCCNKACANPDHLEWVTHAENSRRALIKEACKRGHRWDEQVPIISPSGTRGCRICHRERERGYRSVKGPERAARRRKGRAKGERNANAKLTDADVRAIRASILPSISLAEAYGVDDSVISRARSRKTWKHVT